MLFGEVVEVMEEVAVVITANRFRFRRQVRIRLIVRGRCRRGYRRVPASKELTTSLPPPSSLEATARAWTTRMYGYSRQRLPRSYAQASWTCSPSPHYLAASPPISHSTFRSAPTSSGFGIEAEAGSTKKEFEKEKEEVAAENGVLSIKPQVSLTGPILVSKYGTLCFPTYIGRKILPKITDPKWSQ